MNGETGTLVWVVHPSGSPAGVWRQKPNPGSDEQPTESSQLALAGLAFAAIEARTTPDAALAALFVAGLAGLGFWQIEARHGAAALVPLGLFRLRAFRGAMIATMGMTFAMYGVLFLLPVTWESSDHMSAAMAGLALMPMALVFVLVSPASGHLTRRFDTGVTTGGGLLIGVHPARSGFLSAEIGLAATGLGMGMATGPLMGAAVGAVAAVRAGTASALINVARMIGATLGVALLGAVYALGQGGAAGLRGAMMFSALLLVASSVLAWRSLSDDHRV